jgi:hypothetical protein
LTVPIHQSSCLGLDGPDVVERVVERRGHGLVRGVVVVGVCDLDGDRPVPVTLEQPVQFVLRNAGQHGRVRDLESVQVQDGQDRAVAHRVEELVRVPGGGQRPGLRLAVADHAGDHEVRIVEGGAVGVRHRIAQFAALVDGPGGLGRDVARNAAGEGELAEEPAHALFIQPDARVDLAVGALQVGVRHQPWAAVTGPRDVDRVQVARLDLPVEVRVDEVEAGRGAPVAEQPRLDVLLAQRLAQQRVVEQVDLSDGQVIGGTPVGVDQVKVATGKRPRLAIGHCRPLSIFGSSSIVRPFQD